jgi:hypothetical protein
MRCLLVALIAIGCGPGSRPHAGDDGGGDDAAACSGLQCQVVDCAAQGRSPTTISGTVYAPNGTLALLGAQVYVPLADPGPFPAGVQCSQCSASLPGGAIASAISDEAGRFTLTNVPAGTDIPLLIAIGKWRRRVSIPSVAACTSTILPPALTALPRSRAEGDLPRIAIGTGQFDALECLVRKLGVADTEFSAATGAGSVHLYANDGGTSPINGLHVGTGATKTTAGETFAATSTLWNSLDALKTYDIVVLGCEGFEFPEAKPQAAMDAIKAYADLGGRVFLSHFQNVWLAGSETDPLHAPAVWKDVATCTGHSNDTASYVGMIDQASNPDGAAFAQWMMNVFGSSVPGQFPIAWGTTSKHTCTSVDTTRAERWVSMTSNGQDYPQIVQFTAPLEAVPDQRCGRVVFSDLHVSADSTSAPDKPFPTGCTPSPLTPQEKALAYLLFDIATCVGPVQ